jgi:NifU-like protein
MTPLELLSDHAHRPRNIGKLPNASAIGDVGSIVAGDAMRWYIAVEQERIRAARFQVFNCSDQVAAASVVTELAMGRTVAEAQLLTAADIRTALGGLEIEHLPPQIWALEGLRTALAVYAGGDRVNDGDHEALVCRCHAVTETTARHSVTIGGAHSLEEMVAATGAGSGCGSCKPDLIGLLDEALHPAEAPTTASTRTTAGGRIQTLLRIQRAFESRLAPSLREHGGDLELWDFDGRLVRVRLRGTLTSDETKARQALEDLEHLLKAQIDPALGVQMG